MVKRRLSVALKRLSVVAAVLAAFVVAGVSPAQASPTGCHEYYNGLYSSWMQCTAGSGQYRVVTTCDNWLGGVIPLTDYTRYGAWVAPPQISSTSCDSGDPAYNLHGEFRTTTCVAPRTSGREADLTILC